MSQEEGDLSLPKGLVLAPTRELCMQIEKQAKELMVGLSHMKTALIVGGLPLPNQIYRLQQGVQIVFATPGRLAELMDKTDTDLSEIQILVIDEVDVLLQMGFEKQVCLYFCLFNQTVRGVQEAKR